MGEKHIEVGLKFNIAYKDKPPFLSSRESNQLLWLQSCREPLWRRLAGPEWQDTLTAQIKKIKVTELIVGTLKSDENGQTFNQGQETLSLFLEMTKKITIKI